MGADARDAPLEPAKPGFRGQKVSVFCCQQSIPERTSGMIISIDKSSSNGVIDALGAASSRSGARIRIVDWNDGTLSVNVIGQIEPDALLHPAITGVHQPTKPYRLASKEHRETTIVRVGDVEIGHGIPVIM